MKFRKDTLILVISFLLSLLSANAVAQLFSVEVPVPIGPPLSINSDGVILGPGPLAPPLESTIEGANFDTNAAHTGSVFIPPDPIGAAGPNHVVSVVNVTIEWHTKAGVLESSQSLASFFNTLSPLTFTFDPKVIYDGHAGRFVVVTLEKTDTAFGDPSNTSRILLAVSDDNDPNGTWYFHAINAKINIDSTDCWADYPGFAVDEEAVYITNNMFSFGGGPYKGQRLWIINKMPLYTGGAAVVTVHDPWTIIGSPDLAMTTQPAHIFESAPADLGTFLVGYSGLNDGTAVFLGIIRVDNPLTVPTFSIQFISFGTIANTDNLWMDMPDAPQLGSGTAIETNDRRALHAVWRNNSLWMTTTIVPPIGPDAGQATAHWVRIDTTDLEALSLADQGDVSGEDIALGTHTFFPSIAVDSADNMGIGFAASGPSIYPGAYYTGRLATDSPGTVQPTEALAEGVDYYVRTFGGSRNRWGDYSGISIDPVDDSTFWVFNEYALERGTVIGDEDGRWGTRWGRFSFLSQSVNPGDVVINELMWMGSNPDTGGSTADEWIELRNTTDSDIHLDNDWNITKKSGDIEVPMLTIPAGKTIPAGGYFLISNFDEGGSQISVIPDLVNTAVSLANNKLQIKLYSGAWETVTLIDTADDGIGAPAAGDLENKYSMARGASPGAPPDDGTLAENWHTADRAIGWDEGATELGTPGHDNASGSTGAAFVTVVASPCCLPADGVSESDITVTVEDADGNPVTTETVTMTIEPADNGEITSPASNNGDGTYTATYTAGTTSGIVTVIATTSNEISGEVEITLIPVCNPGDVSGNGAVTAYDASLILQFVVGLIDIDKFPVEYQQSPITGTPQSYSIAVPHLTINSGKRVQVPINIDDVSGITAGGFVLRYDQNILHAVKVLTSEMLSGYYWQSNIEREGEVRIAFAGILTSSGQGTLFYVEFESLPNNIGKTSPLMLDFARLSELSNITRVNGSIAILPSNSILLQNYPNPFNPVAWIPYLLAEPSDVTIRIYSKTGQLVHALSLGYRSAGIYTRPNQAAYWNGKDEHGEAVASGVYFYSLQAGKFTATRKMVIVK